MICHFIPNHQPNQGGVHMVVGDTQPPHPLTEGVAISSPYNKLAMAYPWIAPTQRLSSPVTPYPYLVMPITPLYPSLPVMISQLLQDTNQPIMGLVSPDIRMAELWMDCMRAGLSGFIDHDGHIIAQHPQYTLTNRHVAHHLASLHSNGLAHQERHQLCQDHLPHLTPDSDTIPARQWVAKLPIRVVMICEYPPIASVPHPSLNITYFAHSTLGAAMDQLFNEPVDVVMLPSCTDHFWAHHTAHLVHDFFPNTELILVDQQPDPELLLTFLCNGGRGHVAGWHDTQYIEKWLTQYAYFQWALHCIRTHLP